MARYGLRMNAQTPGSDPVYKRLYAFPEMVADLLRSLFPDDALGADYDSLRRLPTEYVADDYRQRRGDAVWRLNAESAQGGWLHVLVLLEFQSTDDPSMALRVLEYTAMLYRELLREGSFGAGGGLLPPVLPVVLYNGDLAVARRRRCATWWRGRVRRCRRTSRRSATWCLTSGALRRTIRSCAS